MILGGKLLAKLSRTVHRRVDLPTQLRLNLSQCRNHIGETYLAHDHQIHVARRLFLASCNRAVHERKQGAPLRPWLYRVVTNACLESIFVVWFQASSETFQ